MNDASTPRLAVLIDADNIPAKYAQAIFDEIASFGEASVRRIYGDWSSSKISGWKKVLPELGLVPHHQPDYTKGKNSADIALAIDAMDLLHSGLFSGFCLVTSDSDFTRLASRIREQAIDVYGLGEKKTPEAFRHACKRFIFVENLLPPQEGLAVDNKDRLSPKETPSKAVPLILRAMKSLRSEDDWYTLSDLGKQLVTNIPDFDYRTYNAEKLSDLLAVTGMFEIDLLAKPARVKRKISKNKK